MVEHKPQSGITLYRESLIMLSLADDASTVAVVKAAANYFLYNSAPQALDGVALQIWSKVKYDIDKGRESYETRCKRNRANIQKRYQQNTSGVPTVNEPYSERIPTPN